MWAIDYWLAIMRVLFKSFKTFQYSPPMGKETCLVYAGSPWRITDLRDDRPLLRRKQSNVRKSAPSQSRLKSSLFFLNLDATADKVSLTMTNRKTKKPLLERFFFISEDNYLTSTYLNSLASVTWQSFVVATKLAKAVQSTAVYLVLSFPLITESQSLIVEASAELLVSIATIPLVAFALS